jgi:hypothetical protein
VTLPWPGFGGHGLWKLVKPVARFALGNIPARADNRLAPRAFTFAGRDPRNEQGADAAAHDGIRAILQ